MYIITLLYKIRKSHYIQIITNLINQFQVYDIIPLGDTMISNGVDIVKIDRFNDIKNKTTLLNNIFNENEIKYIEKRNYNSNTVAGLFASKEAVLKAIKKGINDYSLKDIEISHNEDNAPFIILHNSLKEEYDENNFSISISHDGDYAVAYAIYSVK